MNGKKVKTRNGKKKNGKKRRSAFKQILFLIYVNYFEFTTIYLLCQSFYNDDLQVTDSYLGNSAHGNIGVLMEDSQTKNRSKPFEKEAQNMAETVLAVMDKLAGKESDLKLSFEDLTLDMGMFKARLNGAIVLDIVYAKEAKE